MALKHKQWGKKLFFGLETEIGGPPLAPGQCLRKSPSKDIGDFVIPFLWVIVEIPVKEEKHENRNIQRKGCRRKARIFKGINTVFDMCSFYTFRIKILPFFENYILTVL